MKGKIQRPKVAVGVMILKGGKVLLGKRNSSHGIGTWSFPGGHLEYGESLKDCVLREIKEECGVKIKSLCFQSVLNVKKYGRHYVVVGFQAHFKSGEPKLLESDRFDEWRWFPPDKLPKQIFEASRLMINLYKTGKNYFDGNKS